MADERDNDPLTPPPVVPKGKKRDRKPRKTSPIVIEHRDAPADSATYGPWTIVDTGDPITSFAAARRWINANKVEASTS